MGIKWKERPKERICIFWLFNCKRGKRWRGVIFRENLCEIEGRLAKRASKLFQRKVPSRRWMGVVMFWSIGIILHFLQISKVFVGERCFPLWFIRQRQSFAMRWIHDLDYYEVENFWWMISIRSTSQKRTHSKRIASFHRFTKFAILYSKSNCDVDIMDDMNTEGYVAVHFVDRSLTRLSCDVLQFWSDNFRCCWSLLGILLSIK